MLNSILTLDTFSFLIAIVAGITIHEFSHAWMANYLGDPTAKYEGRLSLNPIRHLDPVGTAILLILIFTTGFGFGWGKPVPVNPYNLRHRYGELLVSLAGPFSNFLLSIFLILLIALLPPALTKDWSANFFNLILTVVSINIMLGVFNLIPIPPLDGSKVLLDLLPPGQDEIKANLEKYGPYLLIFLFIFGLGFLGFISQIIIASLYNLGSLLNGIIY